MVGFVGVMIGLGSLGNSGAMDTPGELVGVGVVSALALPERPGLQSRRVPAGARSFMCARCANVFAHRQRRASFEFVRLGP